MKEKVVNISGRECHVFSQEGAEFLLIQPADRHEVGALPQEVGFIRELSSKPFTLAAFMIDDWNRELAPWPAPPVFGREPFGDGAAATLAYITDALLPSLHHEAAGTGHIVCGGYSLAGLFSLWASYHTSLFDAVVAASPSVWYPDWIDHAEKHRPQARNVYLSLGDKEEKTRHAVMSRVGNNIRRQYEMLKDEGVNTVLEWNEGNHFVDAEKRLAKGFAWAMSTEQELRM